MRILVTKLGEEIINNLSQELNKEKLNKIKSQYKQIDNSLLTSLETGTNTNHNQSLENIPTVLKKVKIKQKKINIPKNIAEKYNQYEEKNDSNTLLPNIFMSIDSQVTNTSPTNIKKYYSIKEVLPKKTFDNLKLQIKEDYIIKDKNTIIDSTKFRSPYREKNYVNKIITKADRLISSDKVNLIQYLQNKEKITKKFLTQLSNYEEERLIRINKMCQKLIHSKEREFLFNNILQNKIRANNMKIREQYKNKLTQMENEVESIKTIVEKQTKPVKNKERYYYIHRDIESKWWDRYNVNKLYKRNNK